MLRRADPVEMHGKEHRDIRRRDIGVPFAFGIHHDVRAVIAGGQTAGCRDFDAWRKSPPGNFSPKCLKDRQAALRAAGGQGLSGKPLIGADEKVMGDA